MLKDVGLLIDHRTDIQQEVVGGPVELFQLEALHVVEDFHPLL